MRSMKFWVSLLGACALLALTAGVASSARAGEAGAAGSARQAETGAPLDLIGAWFVLVHYRDSATNNPHSDRWEDRVWVFERSGSRIEWTDYPIVFFQDQSGRFEARAGNPRARTLEKWEPNGSQLDQIHNGPRVNTRGSKSKTLRGSTTRGYESVGGARASSAMTFGYQETWKIESLAALPVFSRRDVMSSGLTQSSGGSLDGLTRYATTKVVNRDLLRGSFSRDESRQGEFKMMRTPIPRGLDSNGKTPNEKLRERIQDDISQDIQRRAMEGDSEAVEIIEEYMRGQGVGQD
jgi:hypothetical protein